jgi:ribosomal protein S18 acetylase RimI-like enzyme
VIRSLDRSDAEACDSIIAGLPQWFGVEEGIERCAAAVRSQRGVVSLDQDGAVAGFLTFEATSPGAAEITWMAVRADARRRGHGRALVEAILDDVRADGARFLLVKTLSSREPDPNYAQTRAFYRAMAFEPLTDLDLWGPGNPALLMIRTLA